MDKKSTDGRITLAKAVGHFRTITHHHNLVCGYCLRAGLVYQGLMHDLSKYSPTEFLVGARYWQEGKRSPNNAEREATGVSTSWLHHKGRNKHHFEYWIDYSQDRTDPHILAGAQMPRRYVAEMIFDRVSASRVYLGEKYTEDAPLQYFLRSRDKSWFIHAETKREMEFLLRMWAKRGEEFTIRYIRNVYLPHGIPKQYRVKEAESTKKIGGTKDMAKLSEIRTIVKAKGAGSTYYGNINADPVYISRGIREVFFINEEGVQKVINAVGAFQNGDFGTAAEHGKAEERPGHEYGRYEIADLSAEEGEDAGVWVHRAGDSILVYFLFER